MTRAASCAEIPDATGKIWPLIDRLCDVNADVVYFPVRHHSPACATLVAQLFDQLRPAAVLVEGPSDFNDRMAELLLDHELPIAIYSYFRCGPHHAGAYYPFCEYSPEWTVLRRAHAAGTLARFIDSPWTQVAHHDRLTHRYADAELRRGRYVQSLCQRLHVEDFDDLWDKLIESHESLELADYLRRVHSLCFHIRLWEDSISVSDRQREAYMAEQIRAARGEVSGPLLVVTGGFHSSALVARLENFDCPGIFIEDAPGGAAAPHVSGMALATGETTVGDALPGASALPLTKTVPVADDENEISPDIEDAGISLTTYSYERLDNLTGYNAGMPSPGFYEHAWQQRQAGKGFSHRPLLVKLVQELRERKQTLSTADLIAVETSARALAALRGRPHVWRRDLIDAVTTSLIKDELEYGCESPFVDAVHAVLRGRRRGQLAAGTRMPPLVLDIRKQLSDAGLEPAPAIRNVELDLLSAADLPKSRLLHRLKVLGVVGFDRIGGTDFLVRDDLTRLWESWRVRWSPEFESTCIEASRYGTSLSDAVAARLAEAARDHDRDAAAAAELLVQAAQAGVETMSTTLLDRLTSLIQQEVQFTGAATALQHLLFLFCHDEAFGTSRLSQVGRLLAEAFGRSLWLLEMLGKSAGNEAGLLKGMKALLETFQRAGDALELDRSEFLAVLSRVERDSHKPAAVRGAAAGILWTLGIADEGQILSDLLMFATPNDLGDFLAGLFALAREVAQRHAKLVQTIDRLLIEFGAEDFQAALPSLRLAFTYFTPREKHYMLTTLFESLGLKETRPLATLSVNEATAAEALAFEERLFDLVSKYGLEEKL